MPPSPKKQQIRDLHANGMSVPDISRKLNCSRHLVRYHVKPDVQQRHAKAAIRRKQAALQIIKEIHGNKCQACGYDRCNRALEMHHLDPETKVDFISRLCRQGKIKQAREEANKCIMVCANCHREIHNGVRTTDGLSPIIDDLSRPISIHLGRNKKDTTAKLAGEIFPFNPS